MATQAKCEKCRVRIDYGAHTTLPLRRLACPWCQGPVSATSSNMTRYPTLRRNANGLWPFKGEGLQTPSSQGTLPGIPIHREH